MIKLCCEYLSVRCIRLYVIIMSYSRVIMSLSCHTVMLFYYSINSITSRQPNELLRTILYRDCKFKDNVNKQILIATIQFIKNSNRFNQSLIQPAKINIKNYTEPSVTFAILIYFISLWKYVCMPYCCIETIR